MHLTLSPQMGLPGQSETTIAVDGDTLILDGTPYDLSAVPEGGEIWPGDDTPFIAPVRRSGGVIHATIIARLDGTAEDDQTGPWVIECAAESGSGPVPVAIPAARKPPEAAQ